LLRERERKREREREKERESENEREREKEGAAYCLFSPFLFGRLRRIGGKKEGSRNNKR
jgi:hypothetical protein